MKKIETLAGAYVLARAVGLADGFWPLPILKEGRLVATSDAVSLGARDCGLICALHVVLGLRTLVALIAQETPHENG